MVVFPHFNTDIRDQGRRSVVQGRDAKIWVARSRTTVVVYHAYNSRHALSTAMNINPMAELSMNKGDEESCWIVTSNSCCVDLGVHQVASHAMRGGNLPVGSSDDFASHTRHKVCFHQSARASRTLFEPIGVALYPPVERETPSAYD